MMEEGKAVDIGEERRRVHGFIKKLVGQAALADDLTQEVFLRAERAASAPEEAGARKGWLYTVALNVARDHFRSTGRRPVEERDRAFIEEAPSREAFEKDLLRAEMSACVSAFLLRLPSPQRDVLALHDMAGFKHREIAAQLGISEANSRVMLHRGRAAFRRVLEENCDLSPGCDDIPCERKSGSASEKAS